MMPKDANPHQSPERADIPAFVLSLSWDDLSERVRSDALRGLTDTLGVGIAASDTRLAHIIKDHAARHFAAGEAVPSAALWQDGRHVSPVGAALAHGMTIDALDAHDGSKPTKGHVGCGVVAAALATAQDCSGRELLTRIAIGYEIGTRAGIALHATAQDYHTSGAWIAIAAAAITARSLGLDAAQTREAMGIAEYHGPRSPMMRCIDHPTMVKDGSGWGAMAGVSAAFLAQDGFTGAPALSVEGPEVATIWADLGTRWYIHEQYIKLYPVCRWAQPAVEAVLAVLSQAKVVPHDIATIHVETFAEAGRLATLPITTEEAQYSLPFSVAVAALRGTISAQDVGPAGFEDPEVLALARRVHITTRADYDDAFPARRFATAHVQTHAGAVASSERMEARGDPEQRLHDDVVRDKFLRLSRPVLGMDHAAQLLAALEALPDAISTETVVRLVSAPPTNGAEH
ncbi:MAG: MmgE/PrpD family protein [Shimia sp.]